MDIIDFSFYEKLIEVLKLGFNVSVSLHEKGFVTVNVSSGNLNAAAHCDGGDLLKDQKDTLLAGGIDFAKSELIRKLIEFNKNGRPA